MKKIKEQQEKKEAEAEKLRALNLADVGKFENRKTRMRRKKMMKKVWKRKSTRMIGRIQIWRIIEKGIRITRPSKCLTMILELNSHKL